MTDRERLIEILSVPIHPRIGADPAEVVADYLLDNGVIVPPVRIGDVVYVILNCNAIISATVNDITIHDRVYIAYTDNLLHKIKFSDTEMGKTVFLTFEEAEAELKERELNG